MTKVITDLIYLNFLSLECPKKEDEFTVGESDTSLGGYCVGTVESSGRERPLLLPRKTPEGDRGTHEKIGTVDPSPQEQGKVDD